MAKRKKKLKASKGPSINSRRKGANGERDAAKAVAKHWWAPDCYRSGQSQSSDAMAEVADLSAAVPKGHVEVKRYKAIRALRFMEQSAAAKPPRHFPLVLMREDRDREWVCMFRIRDTDKLMRGLAENRLRLSELEDYGEG